MEENKHAGGRPPLWETPEQLEVLVDDYFTKFSKVTISGLALHLGIERKTLYNYEDKPQFLHIIKKARQTVEAKYEEMLIYDRNMAVIFPLKNMGWTDKTEVEQKTTIEDKRLDLSKLTDDELRVLATIKSRSGIS